MDCTGIPIEQIYESQEHSYQSQQAIISDLSQDCYEMYAALNDILFKIGDTHPDLVIKYMNYMKSSGEK